MTTAIARVPSVVEVVVLPGRELDWLAEKLAVAGDDHWHELSLAEQDRYRAMAQVAFDELQLDPEEAYD